MCFLLSARNIVSLCYKTYCIKKILTITLFSVVVVPLFLGHRTLFEDKRFISYNVDPAKQKFSLFWKNEHGEIFGSIKVLKAWLDSKNQTLVFAMNGGMYKEDHSPLGLYIERGKQLSPLNTNSGEGNFYLKPNGVFYVTADNKAFVTTTEGFKSSSNILYATQSGPMLLTNGKIHTAFKAGSSNLNIRNGVGILPNNTVLFVMSKEGVNLYDFAMYFQKMGCKNALYLDGFVSRTYLPEQNWIQEDGNFGVMIGVTK